MHLNATFAFAKFGLNGCCGCVMALITIHVEKGDGEDVGGGHGGDNKNHSLIAIITYDNETVYMSFENKLCSTSSSSTTSSSSSSSLRLYHHYAKYVG